MYKVNDIVKIDNTMGLMEKEFPEGWLDKSTLYLINQVDGEAILIQRCDSEDTGFWIHEYNITKASISNYKTKTHRVNLIEI